MNDKKWGPCVPNSPSTMVAGKKRIRNTLLHVWRFPDERAKIQERMADVGIRNLSVYVRKMALNGYVLHVDLAPIKDIVSLQKDYADLWRQLSELLERLLSRIRYNRLVRPLEMAPKRLSCIFR